MKKFISTSTIATAFVLFIFSFGQQLSYVGAGKCKICHQSEKQGRQFPIWSESKHSQSFVALASEKAQPIAQELGLTNPQESPKCFECHSPLAEKAADLKAEGVSCEVCHGPGSAYKTLSIMKNKEEAVKNGLILYGSPEAIKKQCLTCHQNAHGKSFDFTASWENIKHTIPEK
jgi:hypothetical protein